MAVDLILITRVLPGNPPEVVIGGFVSLLQKLRWPVHRRRLDQQVPSAISPPSWWQRVGQHITGPSSVEAEESPQLGTTLVRLIREGERLFFNEPFGGNGRTCGTCHRAQANFSLPPNFIAALPSTDALFVATPTASAFQSALAGLENPELLQQRGLILENIGGFIADGARFNAVNQEPVFRAPPHLFNLVFTAPYGLSGEVLTLPQFTMGAVIQHFPKSLERIVEQDFRIPTQRELEALEAFQLSLAVPQDDHFDVEQFLTTDAQRRGRDLFFGPVAKCSQCHGGSVLAEAEAKLGGGNRAFNTGVAASLQSNPPLPSQAVQIESGREFSTPPLFGIGNTGPFFHDNSAADLRAAVTFYELEFNVSPAAQMVGPITLSLIDFQDVDDLVAFLEALQQSPCKHDGDVNQDGQVTPTDARLAFREFLAPGDLPTCQQTRANVDTPQGSAVTLADVVCIFRSFLRLPSCAGGPGDTTPARVIPLPCGNCTGRAGEEIPLGLRVLNAGANSIAGQEVVFRSLGVTESLGVRVTDEQGQVTFPFLAEGPGIFRVEATVANGVTFTFHITVERQTATGERRAPVPCLCTAAPGDTLEIGVRVTDLAGQGVAGLSVSYEDFDEGLVILDVLQLTGQDGTATVHVLAGENPGVFTVTAPILNPQRELIDSVVFTIVVAEDQLGAVTDGVVVGKNTVTPINVLANDAGSGLSVVGITPAVHGEVTITADNTITYVPSPDFTGLDTFTYTVSDGANTDTARVDVGVFDSPAQAEILLTDQQGQLGDTVTFGVFLANTPAPILSLDLGINFEPGVLRFESFTRGSMSRSLFTRGLFFPGRNFLDFFPELIPSGATGSLLLLDFTVVGTGAEPSSTLSLSADAETLDGSLLPLASRSGNFTFLGPVAIDDAAVTEPESAVVIEVLTNDRSFSSPLNPSSVSLTDGPDHGMAVINSDGTITYTPAAGFIGPDTFRYIVADANASISNAATVAVQVGPLAISQTVSTQAGRPISIPLTGTDPDNDALTFAILGAPVNGTLSGTPPDITYTPNASFIGLDTFIFSVSDGILIGDATVTIRVNLPANLAPLAISQTVSTQAGRPISIPLTGTDPDNDALTFAILSAPINGTLSGTPPDITYTPDASVIGGLDTFIFSVSDGILIGDATVTINITSR